MFVDSASRLQRPYSVREKSAAAILSVVKRFVADMGIPRAFRTDNGTEYSNSMFVDFCNGLGIRREFTAPYTPQQNEPVESAISQAFKAGHAARLGVPQLYPDIRLEEIRGCTDVTGTSLWLESLLWAFFSSFFFFHLTYSRWTSLPSCLWSQRIFPSLPGSRLTIGVLQQGGNISER